MTPDRREVEEQLSRILRSPRFSSAPRMSELLVYLVRAALEGTADKLKGYSIGVDVFGRPESFDPSTDSIVRVQTGRLRRLLDAYYASDGAGDPIGIEIGKGRYVPAFTYRRTAEEKAVEAPRTEPQAAPARLAVPSGGWIVFAALALLVAGLVAWPFLSGEYGAGREGHDRAITIAILPFQTTGGDSTDAFLANGITSELIAVLNRMPAMELASAVSVAEVYGESRKADLGRLRRTLNVDYALEGSLQRAGDRVRVHVQLLRTDTGRTIWAEDYEKSHANIFSVQDEIVLALASELRPRVIGAVTEALSDKPTDEQTAWELYLQATWTPGAAVNRQDWETERAELARRALELRPDFGAAHAVYANKLAYVSSLVPQMDTPQIRQTIAFHARRAMDLSPDDSDAVFNIALHYWHSGNIPEAADFIKRVLELDPSHPVARFVAEPLAYTCRHTPSAVIAEMIAYDRALASDSPVRWLTLAWIAQAYLNNGDYALAAEYAVESGQIFRTPESAYRLAALLVKTGRPEAAGEVYRGQKQAWPGLDADHFAGVTIAGRCQGTPIRDQVVSLYRDMADTVGTPA